MKYRFAIVFFLALAAISTAGIAAARPEPLSKDDILKLLHGGVTSKRITSLVQDRGVDFELTDSAEQELRRAGADRNLLLAIAKTFSATGKPAPPTGLPPVPNDAASTVLVRQVGHGQIISPACSDARNQLGIDEVSTGYRDPASDMRFTVTNIGNEELYVDRVNCREVSRIKPRDSKRCIYSSSTGWIVRVAKVKDLFDRSGSATACKQAFEDASPAQTTQAAASRPQQVPAPPKAGSVHVVTEPGGVQIYLDDEPKGMTSSEGRLVLKELPAGTYRVRASLIGYKEWAQSVTLAAGQDLQLDAKLEVAGPKPLTRTDIKQALENSVAKPRILTLINQYGVDFMLSNEVEKELRSAGADDSVILAIMKNKK